VRQHAKNMLKGRDADDVAAKLEAWVSQLDKSDPQYEQRLLEALWTAAATALDKPLDRWLDFAVWQAMRDLAPVWLPVPVQEGKFDFGGNVEHLTFALKAVESPDVVQPLLKLIQDDQIPADRVQGVLELIATLGGPKELGAVLDMVVAAESKLPDARKAALLNANVRQPGFGPIPKPMRDTLYDFAAHKGSPIALPALRLIGLLKVEYLRGQLEGRAENEKSVVAERQAALEGLVNLGGTKTREFLNKLASKDQTKIARQLAAEAMTNIDIATAANIASEILAAADPKDDSADLFAAFLNRKGGAAALAKAIDGKKLNPDVAKLGLKAVRSSVQDAKPLTEALTKAGGLTAARTDYTAAEIKAYVDEVLAKGDAARGEAVYRRKEATCMACHAIAGAGGQVGPDMTSIGASAQVDYLVESILIPNKAVKEGYHALKISTLDQKVIVGIKTREADGKIYLRNSEDKEIVVAEKDIDEKAQSRSLMPDGLADQLTRQEFIDLVRFMSELGKVGGPYAPNKARLVRRWQTFEPTNENMHQLRRASAAKAVETPDAFVWSSAYSMTSGEFPLDSLPKLVVWNGSEPFGMVRCQIDVTTGGPIKLKINGGTGLSLWVGSTPVEVKDETILDLKAGLQTLTFSVNLSQRKEGLRVELEDVEGSPARASIVGGK
jgi:putative heme-binding domain-containing protein